MTKLQTIISIAAIIILLSLPSNLCAEPVIWTSGDYEIRNDNEWYHIIELQTYNDVTVEMFEGTSVNQFSMYNNSELTIYNGTIHYLYLYDNAMASLLAGDIPGLFYIDPASTVQVKLYAYDITLEPYYYPSNPSWVGYTLYGRWLNNDYDFNINLVSVGDGVLSHVQIIPEPITLLLLGLGALAGLRRRGR